MDSNLTTRSSATGGSATHQQQLDIHTPSALGEQPDEGLSPHRAQNVTGTCGDDMVRPQPTDDNPYSTHDKKTAAIKVFSFVSKRWNLSDQQAAGLLGTDAETWLALRSRVRPLAEPASTASPPSNLTPYEIALTEDQRSRISIFFYMYVTLHQLFTEESADRWIAYRNYNRVFEGRTPLDVMIEGGRSKIREARNYLKYALR